MLEKVIYLSLTLVVGKQVRKRLINQDSAEETKDELDINRFGGFTGGNLFLTFRVCG